MKVAELIRELQKHDGRKPVALLVFPDDESLGSIDSVSVTSEPGVPNGTVILNSSSYYKHWRDNCWIEPKEDNDD